MPHASEFASLLARLEVVVIRLEKLGQGNRLPAVSASTGSTSKKLKPTLMGYISEMISSGFFKQPKQIGAVKAALEESGQFYPTTTLSPALLRLVRARQLRRIKDDSGHWAYVGS
jgi:hypothetical protein